MAAGENWDDVVARCVAEGLAGLECLSGIPGLAGATPIQNVGAYGQEVADTDRLGPGLGPRPAPRSPTFRPPIAASATGPAGSSGTAATWCWPSPSA